MITQINKLYKEEIINSTIAVFSTRFNFPAPTFCPTIADRAACNAITGKIKITFIFAAIPTAADAYIVISPSDRVAVTAAAHQSSIPLALSSRLFAPGTQASLIRRLAISARLPTLLGPPAGAVAQHFSRKWSFCRVPNNDFLRRLESFIHFVRFMVQGYISERLSFVTISASSCLQLADGFNLTPHRFDSRLRFFLYSQPDNKGRRNYTKRPGCLSSPSQSPSAKRSLPEIFAYRISTYLA